MATDLYGTVSWGPFQNSGALQVHHFKMPFSGAPHVFATAYLSEVSTGGVVDGNAGVAMVCFLSWEYLDNDGHKHTQHATGVPNAIEVEKCVSITIDLEVVEATAVGGWTFYVLS
jgi:hypothetical protein